MSDRSADPIDIRPIAARDQAVWLPLWRGYQAFYGVDISPAVTGETWRRLLDPFEPMCAALAWRDDTAVGLVHWIFHRSTWTVGNSCYLQDLFVDPATRGGGVGRELIAHVYRQAEHTGCARVYWLTHETNIAAMALYDQVAEKSGFVQYRRLIPSGSGSGTG